MADDSKVNEDRVEVELAISTQHLTKNFGEIKAVNGLSISVPYGKIFGLLGPNGAGKSTLIKMLTTLLKPDGGIALVAGLNVVKNPRDVRRKIGYVPQLLSADGSLTGYENLSLSAKLYGLPAKLRKEKIIIALQSLDLEKIANRLVRTYSGGMVRRLELAQALLHEPSILFLDEPTVGLDPSARKIFWKYLLKIRKEQGMTIIISTHDMEEADLLCDELVILHQGHALVSGSPKDLKESIGPNATLGDVFARFTQGGIDGGDFHSDKRTRSTAKRLG
jgi:ABC-2 type transport system ATP-binding protein